MDARKEKNDVVSSLAHLPNMICAFCHYAVAVHSLPKSCPKCGDSPFHQLNSIAQQRSFAHL
ncbi:MAG: hypothetical protein AABZ60_08100, partial [Planctomycetota bacterium]